MSIAMLKNPFKPHDILDDHESLFWSKLFGAIKYLAGAISFDMEVFHQQGTLEIGQKTYPVGGQRKIALLEEGLSQLSFTCIPLGELFVDLGELWRDYYRAKHDYEGRPSSAKYEKNYNEQRQRLSQSSMWYDTIDSFVKRPDWEESDVIEERYAPQPEKEANEQVREQIFTAYMASEARVSMAGTGDYGDDTDNEVEQPTTAPSTAVGLPLAGSSESHHASTSAGPSDDHDAPLLHAHPGPPDSALESVGQSSRGGSAISLSLNSNGKRTVDLSDDDDADGKSAGEPSSPIPRSKRTKKTVPVRATAIAGRTRSRVRSAAPVRSGGYELRTRSGGHSMGSTSAAN